MMKIKLFIQAIIKFTLGITIIGILIFAPAQTINYWNGWLLMGLLFIPMFIAGIIMIIKSLIKSKIKTIYYRFFVYM